MSPSPRETELYVLTMHVRGCFNRLKTLAERLHRDLGITPSMRAVMEALATQGCRSVPDIARTKGVSRQHIQTIVNALLTHGFVAAEDNPAHRRSPLFDLTASGRAAFAEISRREAAPFARLSQEFPASSLRAAQETLAELERRLDDELAKG